MLVVCGDGAAPPGGPYERIIVTAGCWSLPAAVVGSLADGGVLVAPLRVNGVELVLGLRREGDVLRGGDAIPCGFMPLRGGDERPWRWQLGGGGVATADADLGTEGRGALDRLLSTPGRPVGDPLALEESEHALGAILWLGLQGDPMLSLRPARPGRAPAVDRGPARAARLAARDRARVRVSPRRRARACTAASRLCARASRAWRRGAPPALPAPAALELTVERHRDRTGWSLPFTTADGAATMVRGAHRWTLRYGSA